MVRDPKSTNIFLKSTYNNRTFLQIDHFSNPILYAECLKQLGPDLVHKYQGKEPSGRRSNEIALDYDSKF